MNLGCYRNGILHKSVTGNLGIGNFQIKGWVNLSQRDSQYGSRADFGQTMYQADRGRLGTASVGVNQNRADRTALQVIEYFRHDAGNICGVGVRLYGLQPLQQRR